MPPGAAPARVCAVAVIAAISPPPLEAKAPAAAAARKAVSAAAPAPAGTAGPLADDGFAAEFGAPAAATLAKEDDADATAPAPARIAACQAAAIAAFFCDCCWVAEAEALERVEGDGTAVLAALLAATAALAAVIWL